MSLFLASLLSQVCAGRGVRKGEVIHSRWQRIFRCFVSLRFCQDYPARLQPKSSPTIRWLRSRRGAAKCPGEKPPAPTGCCQHHRPAWCPHVLGLLLSDFCSSQRQPQTFPTLSVPRTVRARRSWERLLQPVATSQPARLPFLWGQREKPLLFEGDLHS